MELRQLTYFDAIARHGGFTRAAEHLRIAQPAVSAQIKLLERELGVTLLDRTTRRVALTQAGELFLVRARAVLDQLSGARTDLGALAAVLRGELRIGVTPVVGGFDLPGALAQFRSRYHDVTLTLRTGLVSELVEQLGAGLLDAVVGPLHSDLPTGYVGVALVAEGLVVVAPPGRRPRSRSAVTLKSFRDEPFVCLPASSGLHAILVSHAAGEGFVPRIEFEAPTPAYVRELVAAGLGVALLAESAALAPGPRVDVHRLDPAPQHPPIGVVTAGINRESPAARAWRTQLEELAGAGRRPPE